jgi:hypothetical protein
LFEAGVNFISNASGVLKPFSRLFHLFAHVMGNIPGFVNDLVSRFLGYVGRVVELLLGLVCETGHSPADFLVPVLQGFSGSAGEHLGALFEETAGTPGIDSNAAAHFVARFGGKHDRRGHTDSEAGQQRHEASGFSHPCELLPLRIAT